MLEVRIRGVLHTFVVDQRRVTVHISHVRTRYLAGNYNSQTPYNLIKFYLFNSFSLRLSMERQVRCA